MKSLSQFINESSKSFTLDSGERQALAEFVGLISGILGDEGNQFTDIEVDNDDKKALEDAYDVLDDEHTYPKISKRLIKGDIPVLKKYLNMAWKNGNMDANHDLQDAMDKISE